MKDDHDDASHDLRRWLGDEDPPAAVHDAAHDPPRRWTAPRIALALLVASPWVVLAVLAMTGAAGPSTTATSTDGARAPATVPRRPDAPTDDGARPSADPAVHPRSGDAAPASVAQAVDAAPPAVGPTAVRMVRDAVTRAGASSMALDAAAAEEIDTLAAGTWAVRVHAVVLRGDRRRWRVATHEIWVAPVGLRDGRVVGLDRPWRVATLDGDIARTTWRRADVDTDAIIRALDEAGIDRADDLVVEQHPTVPSIVRATTTTGTRHVWVRLTPEPAVVGLDGAGHDR